MCTIPLDLQRKLEQRWAARFARQAPEPSSQKREHEKQDQQLGAPAKAKRKTHRTEPAGSRSARAPGAAELGTAARLG